MIRILISGAARITLFAVLIIAVAACSKTSSSKLGARHTSTTTTASQNGEVPAKLKIVMQHVGGKDSQGVPVPTGLICDKSTPATCLGTVTCPAEIVADTGRCAWIATHGGVLKPSTSARRVCTEQYGGPQSAHVSGTVDGHDVDVTFSRQNGCAMSDWAQAQALWTA